MFAKEGYALIGAAAALAAVLSALGGYVDGILGGVLIGAGVLALAFTMYFFRDPERTPPAEAAQPGIVLVPADGKVVVIQDIDEPLYLKGPAKQVSIFLSPLNVHVNRNPISGVVEYDNYVPGDYLVAWHPKASELNERSQLGVRHESGARVLYKQIAGAVARRIVYHIKVGDAVTAGERFGIVKFGSRMDILMPPDTEVLVAMGQTVKAGETLLARLAIGTDALATNADAEVAP